MANIKVGDTVKVIDGNPRRGLIEGVGGTQYRADLPALYDEVRDNELSTHRSLYAKLEHVLEEMGYVDKNQ